MDQSAVKPAIERILVTGGLGYIGSHTAVELLQEGYDILLLDNLYNSKVKCLERLKQITKKEEIKFVEADLKNYEQIEKVVEQYKPTACIHFAALKAVGESVSKPLEYYDNNLSGTINLMKALHKHSCKKIVFSSSACVYGEGHQQCVEEDTGTPTNPYGQTKSIIEQILKDYSKANPDFLAISLRYFNPVGAHPSGLIGEDPKDIPNNLMPYI
jgi:UDP-glucose 4-epimerase